MHQRCEDRGLLPRAGFACPCPRWRSATWARPALAGRPLRWTTTVPWVALTHPTQVALNDEIRWRLIAIFSGAQRSKYSAEDRFLEFIEAWGAKYPAVIRLWSNAWAEFVPFLQFDREIRRIVCTTDEIVKGCSEGCSNRQGSLAA